MKFSFNNKRQFIFFYSVVLLLLSCNNDEKKIREIKISAVHIEAFEKDIFSMNTSNFNEKNILFSKKYFPFYQYYIKNIIYLGNPTDTSQNLLLNFISDKDMLYAYHETEKIFSDDVRKNIESHIFDLHQHIAYYFPEKKLPQRYFSIISGFNYQIVYPEKTNDIGISLEMYLGSKHPVYQWLQWPQYRVRQLQKEYILPDIAKAWLFTQYPYDNFNNLLEHMIYYGKVIYALKKLLPQTHDSLIFSYTKQQLDYCKKYEKNLWSFFIEEKKLYDNSPKTISAFLNDGPFTAAISKECPPRIGMYIGFKIVESYMNKNKISLSELMNDMDAQKILQRSKYKP